MLGGDGVQQSAELTVGEAAVGQGPARGLVRSCGQGQFGCTAAAAEDGTGVGDEVGGPAGGEWGGAGGASEVGPAGEAVGCGGLVGEPFAALVGPDDVPGRVVRVALLQVPRAPGVAVAVDAAD